MATDASFLDFDAAWLEHDLEPFTLPVPAAEGCEFEGDEVEMPATMPAGYRLHMWRVRVARGDDADLSNAELATAAAFLFGKERVGRWYEQRIPESILVEALQRAAGEYARRDPATWAAMAKESDGSGKAGPPGSEVPTT